MARVFSVPRYEKETWRFLFIRSLGDSDVRKKFMFAASLGIDLGTVQVPEMEAGTESTRLAEDLDAAYGMGLFKDPVKLQRACSVAKMVVAEIGNREIFSDDSAAFALLSGHLSGAIRPTCKKTERWSSLCKVAREIATVGLISSFATPGATRSRVDKMSLFDDLSAKYPKLASMMVASSVWVKGMSDGSVSSKIRDYVNGACDIEAKDLYHSKGQFPVVYRGLKLISFLGISVVMDEKNAYILDNDVRKELAAVLWTPGQMMIYGRNYRLDDRSQAGEAAASEVIEYVTRVLQMADRGKWTMVARHMKTAYAAALARFGYSRALDAEKEIIDWQSQQISAEAEEQRKGFESFEPILVAMGEDLAVDVGTGWNMLPGVDANPRQMDKGQEAQFHKPRRYDEQAWTDLMAYSRGVISAHILTTRKGVPATWRWHGPGAAPHEDPEALAWVVACRTGALTYPGKDNHWSLSRVLPWISSLENWHWGADDVTRVDGDISKYETRQSAIAIPSWERNEMLYAMRMAPLLSGQYTAQMIREDVALRRKRLACLVVLAAKRENTKLGEKVRGTGSASDWARELLSEIDLNLGVIGGIVEGVAMRLGRAKYEKTLSRILGKVREGAALLAADIVGWSPLAPREKHLGFIDMLIEFFDAPTGTSASWVFSDVKVLVSKQGYHHLWDMRDGTFQGFTGTGDSILHSMMAQWAFVKCREAKLFAPNSTCAKAAMIDDIIIALARSGVSLRAVLEAMSAQYIRLGYTPDLVKTLISNIKGHFLNRLYYGASEVITACKIFARADVQTERSMSSIWSDVDSVMGGFLGASDRSAPSALCYTQAIWRSITLIDAVASGIVTRGLEYTAVAAFMPRSLGGHGLPSYAQWSTRDSLNGMASCISVPIIFARCIRDSDPGAARAISKCVSAWKDIELKPRSVRAICDDPHSISAKDIIDPESIVGRAVRTAAKKCLKAEVFTTLANATECPGYDEVLRAVVNAYEWPAPIIQEWSATLPHAVISSILRKGETNQSILRVLHHKDRHAAVKDLRKANRASVRFCERVEATWNNLGVRDASSITLELRDRQQDVSGYYLSDLNLPSSLDIVAQNPASQEIIVSVPKHDNNSVYTGGEDGTLRRTYVSKPMMELVCEGLKSTDPVTRTVPRIMTVVAACVAVGIDPKLLVAAYSLLWSGSPELDGIPVMAVSGTNTRRLAQRLNRRTYTVCAGVNTVGKIVVNASDGIQRFEGNERAFDWMSVMYALRASAYVDMELGNVPRSGAVRHYNLRATATLFRSSTPDAPPGGIRAALPPFGGCVADREGFVARLKATAALVRPLGADAAPPGTMAIARDDSLVTFSATDYLRMMTVSGLRLSAVPLAGMRPSERIAAGAADVTSSSRVVGGSATGKKADRVVAALMRLVEVVMSDADDPAVRKARGAVMRLTHNGLSEVLGKPLASAVHPLLESSEAEDNRKAARNIGKFLMSSDVPAAQDMAGYHAGAAASHRARADDESIPQAMRYRSAMLSSVLGLWATSPGSSVSVKVDQMITGVVGFIGRKCGDEKTSDEITQLGILLASIHTDEDLWSEHVVARCVKMMQRATYFDPELLEAAKTASRALYRWVYDDVIAPAARAVAQAGMAAIPDYSGDIQVKEVVFHMPAVETPKTLEEYRADITNLLGNRVSESLAILGIMDINDIADVRHAEEVIEQLRYDATVFSADV